MIRKVLMFNMIRSRENLILFHVHTYWNSLVEHIIGNTSQFVLTFFVFGIILLRLYVLNLISQIVGQCCPSRPVPKHLHTAGNNGRYSTIQCRISHSALTSLLRDCSSFVLVEGYSYVKLIYR